MDLFILAYLCVVISKLAVSKNLPKWRWIIRTIMYWLLGDLTAMYLVMYIGGISITPETLAAGYTIEVFYVLAAGILGGFLGYLLVKKQLEDYPSNTTDV